MLKKLTDGLDEKIIQFQITCYNPTNWRASNWKYDCHRDGISSYILYQTTLENGVMTVINSSGILNGETPYTPDNFVPLFDYDVCAGKVINENKKLFKKYDTPATPAPESTPLE
jgi:peptidoglycan/xylan/chitin deacetylase (PgdA/CDA1 family)